LRGGGDALFDAENSSAAYSCPAEGGMAGNQAERRLPPRGETSPLQNLEFILGSVNVQKVFFFYPFVFFSDSISIKYYNIPAIEMEQKYLTEFVKDIIVILHPAYVSALKDLKDAVNVRYEGFLMYLPHFTKDELAIIRNCLFAQRGYKFKSAYWKQFMETYYSNMEHESCFEEYRVNGKS
jgi:hypothetical protein